MYEEVPAPAVPPLLVTFKTPVEQLLTVGCDVVVVLDDVVVLLGVVVVVVVVVGVGDDEQAARTNPPRPMRAKAISLRAAGLDLDCIMAMVYQLWEQSA